MKTLTIRATFIGVVFAMAFVLASLSAGAQSWVDSGLDLDPTGNDARTLGEVQSCRSVEPGTSFEIDFWVRGVPPVRGDQGGILGFAFNLIFDPALLRVTAVDNDFLIFAQDGQEPVPFERIDADSPTADVEPLPAVTGNLRADVADLTTDFEDGTGVLSRLTLEALAPGTSALTLQDDFVDQNGIFPAPYLLSAKSMPMFINAVQNGVIEIGQPCSSAPEPVNVFEPGQTALGGGAIPALLAPDETVPAVVEAQPTLRPAGSEVPTGVDRSPLPEDTAAPGETSVAVDVIPEDNEVTSLGDTDPCAAADEGDSFSVDIVVTDIEDLIAWEAAVVYDPDVLSVVGRDVKLFVADSEGSQVIDSSAQVPDDSGQYTVGAVNTDTDDPISSVSGSGVLARLTFEAVGEGASTISVKAVDLNDDELADRGMFLRNAAGDIIGDTNDDTFFDGATTDGQILVGEECDDPDARVVQVEVEDTPDSTRAASETGTGGANINDDDDDDGNSLIWILLGAGAVIAAVAGVGYFFLQSRRNTAS